MSSILSWRSPAVSWIVLASRHPVLLNYNRYVLRLLWYVGDVVFVYAEYVAKSLGYRYVSDDSGTEVDPAHEEHVE